MSLVLLPLGGWWWWKSQQRSLQEEPAKSAPPSYDAAAVQREWALVDDLLVQLQTENPQLPPEDAATYQSQRQTLVQQLQATALHVAVTGNPKTGKTALIEQLKAYTGETLQLREVPLTDTATLLASDALIVLTTGDLTQSELDCLLACQGHPGWLLVINKQDQFLPNDLAIVVAQVQQHLQRYWAPSGDGTPIPVCTIAARPAPIQRRILQADQTWSTSWQPTPPVIAPVLHQLEQWLQPDRVQQLICATAHRQSIALKQQIHQQLNQARRTAALDLIQRAQGIAALSAAVNPFPTLDLLTTLAVNSQLVVDLFRLYRQPITLQQGDAIAAPLATLLIKMGFVEFSSQALTHVLKTYHLTYWAAAVLQGVSAAYLTRGASLALVDYLESLEPGETWSADHWSDRLPQFVKNSFATLQNPDFLRSFTQRILGQLPIPTP